MIRFACPTCNTTISAPDDKAGGKGPCPKCGQRVQIPEPPKPPPMLNKTVLGRIEDIMPGSPLLPFGTMPSPVPTASAPPVAQRVDAPMASVVPVPPAATYCPRCRSEISCPPELIGRVVACPVCHEQFVIPQVPVLASAAAQALPDLAPAPAPERRATYRDDEDDEPSRSRRQREQIGFRCPFCQTSDPPRTVSQISQTGWILFIVLLIFCFPLCIIGLFVTEPYRVCSSCGIRLDR